MGTPYEADAARLVASLQRFGIPHDVEGFADRGDWYANTAHKAEFIRGKRRRVRGPLLWLDADAVLHADVRPYFAGLVSDYDVAAHYFRSADGQQYQPDARRLLSGTLWLNDTPAALRLCLAWCKLNDLLRGEGYEQGGGQKNLWYLTTCHPRPRVHDLPGGYCYVFDKPWGYEPRTTPIIEHLIASRENRGPSKGTVHAGRQQRIAELDRQLSGVG